MTAKGKTQITNEHLDEIVPIVRATHGIEAAIEIAQSLLNSLIKASSEIERAKKAQIEKRNLRRDKRERKTDRQGE